MAPLAGSDSGRTILIEVNLTGSVSISDSVEMAEKWASFMGGRVETHGDRITIRLPPEILRDLGEQALIGVLGDLTRVGMVNDFEVPPDVESRLGGPGVGLIDLSRELGLRGPGVASHIRLPPGAAPADVGRRFYELALRGLDVGVDPPWLVKPDEVSARSSHIADMRDRVREETGRRVDYVVNVSGWKAVENANRAMDSGARLLGFSLRYGGWMGLLEFRRNLGAVPIFVYGRETEGLSPPARCRLARLLGGSMVGVPAVGNGTDVWEFRRAVNALTSEDRIGKSMPVIQGAIHPGTVESNLENSIEEVLIMPDSPWLHPNGEESGISAIRQAIDAFLRGETVLEAAKVSEDLRIALERWGYRP